MQVLLLKDVRKLGHLGDVVEVKTGYARNYLLPYCLATEPTEENIQAIEADKKRAVVERARRFKEFRKLAELVADASITIEAVANPEGTLYGSVGVKEIAAALQELGHPIDAGQVVLDEPVRTLDNRMVTIQFADDVSAEVKLWVVRAGEFENAKPADDADGSDDHQRSDDEPAFESGFDALADDED